MQEILSLGEGDILSNTTIYEKMKTIPKPRERSPTEELMLLFGDCIANSFKNGFARNYLEVLLLHFNAKSTHVCSAQLKLIGFYLKIESYRLKSPSSTPSDVRTRSSYESSYESNPVSSDAEKKHESPLVKSSKRHYAQDVRIPDFVVYKRLTNGTYFGTPCTIIIEVKSKFNEKELREGISQILSYGLSQRCQYKSENEILLLLITPRYWIYGILPPFGKQLNNLFVLTKVNVFEVEFDGGVGLQKNNYIYILKLLSRFFS